jgi:hypothetical protein
VEILAVDLPATNCVTPLSPTLRLLFDGIVIAMTAVANFSANSQHWRAHPTKKKRLEVIMGADKKNSDSKVVDPVTPNQGGRMMPSDPITPTRDDAVRQKAYEYYQQRGARDGQALDDWLRAESQLV